MDFYLFIMLLLILLLLFVSLCKHIKRGWADIIHMVDHCQCILFMRHILVECSHFAQKGKDLLVFGKRNVMESFILCSTNLL